MEEIPITDEAIRLGQLLMLAGVIGAGAEAKLLLAEERVRVNGEVELRRGRQVRPGDEVTIDDVVLRVVAG